MRQIIFFSVLWFLAGYVSVALANQFINLPLGAVQCGWLSLLLGLIGLVPIISTERGRRLFYSGPEEDEDGDPRIGCLWLASLQTLLLAILGWIIWLVSYLIGIPSK